MGKTSSPDNIKAALEQYWQIGNPPGHIPDYYGFEQWYCERAGARGPLAPVTTPHDESEPYLNLSRLHLWRELIDEAKNAGIALSKDGVHTMDGNFGASQPGLSALQSMNQAKLLLFLLGGFPAQTRHVLLSLIEDQ